MSIGEIMTFFLPAMVRMATPLLIAALGLSIAELSGMTNIGGEGIMIMGAFWAFSVSRLTGSYWLGLLAGVFASTVMAGLLALLSIRFKANQVVMGTAINMFCSGFTRILFESIMFEAGHGSGTMMVNHFPTLKIPILSDIPIIGPMLFNHNLIVYFGYAMVIIMWLVMNKSSLGIRIISVGEHPKAADSLGIKVNRIRYLAMLFSGVMIGIAGVFLSIAQASSFGPDMTGGRGFIALAVVILGKWDPLGILLGALLFGGANALQMNLQNMGSTFPKNLIMMIPYIATVVAVVSVSKRKVGAPSAQGIPYEKS